MIITAMLLFSMSDTVVCMFLYKLGYKPMKVKATPKSQAKVGFVTQTEGDDESCVIFCVIVKLMDLLLFVFTMQF